MPSLRPGLVVGAGPRKRRKLVARHVVACRERSARRSVATGPTVTARRTLACQPRVLALGGAPFSSTRSLAGPATAIADAFGGQLRPVAVAVIRPRLVA